MIDNANPTTFTPIGYVSSPYKEKFAIPRQPGLVSNAKGSITLVDQANNIELVRGLEQFSHIWVIFVFHGTKQHGWKPLVRPPRLGGNKKIGVLATRSTFRPNPIGMSVVKLDNIALLKKNVVLTISGHDLLDHTPVIDIKPYVPYSDIVLNAEAGYAHEAPLPQMSVSFSKQVNYELQAATKEQSNIKALITEVLQQDPRPAYKKNTLDEQEYGIRLYHFNIKWRLISASEIEVFEIQ